MRLLGEGLACVRGGREVFDGVGFSVASGELLQLRGPNGAGKSSLLRLIAGLVRPTAGRLALEGGAADVPVAEQAHYVGHLDALKPALSVAENLGFWADMLGGPDPGATTDADGRSAEALEAVGIAPLADFPAAVLSAGQRRRLSLARLAAASRPVWLLDEPTTALDTDGQARLFRLIEGHLAGGGLALIATHVDLPLPTTTLALGRTAP